MQDMYLHSSSNKMPAAAAQADKPFAEEVQLHSVCAYKLAAHAPAQH
jgi:hypothetical protein